MHPVVIVDAAGSPSADTTAERPRWPTRRPHPHSTLMHEMKRPAADHAGKRPYYGAATLCVGVGMGVSIVIEWLDV